MLAQGHTVGGTRMDSELSALTSRPALYPSCCRLVGDPPPVPRKCRAEDGCYYSRLQSGDGGCHSAILEVELFFFKAYAIPTGIKKT